MNASARTGPDPSECTGPLSSALVAGLTGVLAGRLGAIRPELPVVSANFL